MKAARQAQVNGTPAAAGRRVGSSPANNLVSLIEHHRVAFPDRAALRWIPVDATATWNPRQAETVSHRSLTYGELAARVGRVAHAFNALGLRRGDRVILFLPMGPLMYIAMLAVQRVGAIAVFLDSWARRHQLAAVAACAQPVAMISHPAAFDMVADRPEFAGLPIRIAAGGGSGEGLTARLETLLDAPDEIPVAAVEAEDTALVTFTTGSSGVPKGANRTHRFLRAQHAALSRLLPYDDDDIDLPAFPIFSLNNLACGVTTVLPAIDLAAPDALDAARLVAQIRMEGVTCATLSPAMVVGLSRFCAQSGIVLDALRRVVTGGAPISPDTARAFLAIAPSATMQVLYGSTEVEPMAHIEAREMIDRTRHPDPEWVGDGVNVGRVCPELDYRFIPIRCDPVELDDAGWESLDVPRGEAGELVVTGNHVCRDYYNNPEAFRRSKIVDRDGRIWHRTGDVGYVDADGFLWIVGRVHTAIERAGRYLFPVQAEIILKRCGGVEQAAFLGLPDERLGHRTVAAVALETGAVDATKVRADIERLFGKHRIPLDEVVFVDTIPMDARHHSKVEYDLLRETLLAGGDQG